LARINAVYFWLDTDTPERGHKLTQIYSFVLFILF